jgi:hypothetical protein
MALSKVNFNSLNLTPTANKTVVFNSNNNGIEAGDVGGALTLISTQTASSSSTISFTSGIDSTYKEYIFKFINIHPGHSSYTDFLFNMSADSGSNYNVTKQTTYFSAISFENGSYADIEYSTALDTAQGTGFQTLTDNTGNDNDQCLSGTLHLFDPSNTTFVKHFKSRISNAENQSAIDTFVAGYGNTTSAIDAIQFKFLAGNIDSGTIKLYGVS